MNFIHFTNWNLFLFVIHLQGPKFTCQTPAIEAKCHGVQFEYPIHSALWAAYILLVSSFGVPCVHNKLNKYKHHYLVCSNLFLGFDIDRKRKREDILRVMAFGTCTFLSQLIWSPWRWEKLSIRFFFFLYFEVWALNHKIRCYMLEYYFILSRHFMNDYCYVDIASLLGHITKTVYNTSVRIKTKVD